MKEEQKKHVHEKYQAALQRGERFWPDSIYKDLVVSFGIFILLVLLATFVGVPGEPKADPSDSAYVPRPEWYFLFLFKFLALYGQIPVLGKIEWIATVLVPGLALLVLFLLPLTDRNPYRHYSRRTLALTVMGIFVTGVLVLTMMANVPATSGEAGMPLLTLLQFLAGLVLPGLAFLLLIGLALLARKGASESAVRRVGRAQVLIAGAVAAAMLALSGTVLGLAPPAAAGTEVQVASTVGEKMVLGQDLYSLYCTECHGEDGTVAVITGVLGLEGKAITPLHSTDVMYTLDDPSLANVITYGQPDSGMPPFGKAYGGDLSPSDIDNLVAFLRYSWDDRVEPPADLVVSSIPIPGPGEAPTFTINIQPLVKRYCISCHRAGKQNNNYLLTSYEEMLNSGDNAPVMVAGEADSLLLQLVGGHEVTDSAGKTIRAMPPTKLLDQKYIDMLTQWVMNGMPK
jgi:mono/diheme cytochrome c family protein